MFKLTLSILLIAVASFCYGQVSLKGENSYPEGLYKTKEDFIKKVPSQQVDLVAKTLFWAKREVIDTIPDECSFFYKETDKKVKQMFAISYKGQLFIQAGSVLLNRDKKDKSQSTRAPYSFTRVLFGGENYLYLEMELANSWEQGLGYGLGGAAGSVIAQNAIKGKGIVWDFKANQFNIFRSCNDYNEFIADKYAEGVQECKGKQPDILQVREAIDKIK